MAIVSGGSDEALKVLEALGLRGKRVTSLELRIGIDAAVEITVTRLLDGDDLLALAEVCQAFKLVPKEAK